ncbi:MAG TPA: sodium:solute symporter [Terriglobales bacterium]|nr:sodium:solute symporter [Terriglobales bacterium]
MSGLDLAIIAAYLAGITLFGLRFRKQQRSLKDYFLADRNVPWWAISLSIVAAETSTLTIISTPGLSYQGNLTFLQVVLGYLVGRVVISVLMIPHYFRGELFTAYQLMERRFGAKLRSLTASLFLITRAAAEGVRVFAVSIVVGIALGPLLGGLTDLQRDLVAIGIVTALTLIYTFEGGMTAVIWTDVAQMFIYVAGTMVGFVTLLRLIPGGWATVSSVGESAGKFQVLNFTGGWAQPYTFWAGAIGGAFLTTASHGADQLIVQRLLAARSEGQSKLALISSGVAVLFQFSLFMLIGVMLLVFYQRPPAAFGGADRIFPTFIVTRLAHGVAGLLIAAILAAAMSNLSAALNSLSSSTIVDFYLRRRQGASERDMLRVSRVATLAWALALFALAVVSRRSQSVIVVGLSIASVAYGALLGVFLLGLLTKRAHQRGAMAGMLVGFCTNMYIWISTLLPARALPLGWFTRQIPWTWYVAIGACLTFGVGYAASLAMAPDRTTENREQGQHA